jgi:hypothetical protein
MREDQRDAGADEIGKAEGRRHIVFAAQQAIEPVVLIEPKARLDDILCATILNARCSALLASGRCGGEHGSDLDSVASYCSYERMTEG